MLQNKNVKYYCLLLIIISSVSLAKLTNLPDFTELVEKTGVAVVNITARQNAKQNLGRQQQPRLPSQLERYFGIIPPGVQGRPQDRDSVSGGSGFIISTDGYILTNRHVVQGADVITVTLVDRREYEAELIGEDEASDIALLKVEAQNLPILKIGDTNKIKIGEWVMAIGSPLGFEQSVTKGIISAKGRPLGQQRYIPYIQTDVPINRGNSGGPLINMNAEVIGINTIIVSNDGGYMGLSFSIPIDVAMSVVEQLKTSGTVKRGLLGVNIQTINQKMANYLGLKKPQGALITDVNKDSASAKAGFKVQDVIIKFNGTVVDTSLSLPPLVGAVRPGTKVNVEIVRDGKNQTIQAVLGGLDGDDVIATNGQTVSKELSLGFEIADITGDVKEQLNIESGVAVKSIDNRKVHRAGLRVDDVIMQINKVVVKNVTHFKKQLKKIPQDEAIVLLVKQAGANRFIVIEQD
ncbi:MAG: Do family serine endopeptidase [Proteobacteria bacterium]|nr:Do family serine endopeptidase [Pseudomonadota bacterium]